MPTQILVAYATRYGSTEEVAEDVAKTLREQGLTVDIQPIRQVQTLGQYRAIVLGAPLYMFHWHKDARHFLSRHRRELTQLPVAIFAVGPLHVEEKEWQGAQAQLDAELAKFPWLTPITLELFGGKFDPEKLRSSRGAGKRHTSKSSQEYAGKRYTRLGGDPCLGHRSSLEASTLQTASLSVPPPEQARDAR